MTALTIALLALIPVIVAFIVHAERRDEKRQQAREERRRELAGPPSWLDGVPHKVIGPLPRGTVVDDPESSAWSERRAA